MVRNSIWRYARVNSRPTLLVYIFLADLFLVVKDIDIPSYADDNRPFIVEDNTENHSLFDWFKNKRLKSNRYKCHTLVSTSKHFDIKIRNYTKAGSECEKLLGGQLKRSFASGPSLAKLFHAGVA